MCYAAEGGAAHAVISPLFAMVQVNDAHRFSSLVGPGSSSTSQRLGEIVAEGECKWYMRLKPGMGMGKRRQSGLSAKSRRVIEQWGVERALAQGATVVPVGWVYRLPDGSAARLVFLRDETKRLCVGYAIEHDGQWVVQQADPYAARTLGYYRRRLKRIGEGEAPWQVGDQPEREG